MTDTTATQDPTTADTPADQSPCTCGHCTAKSDGAIAAIIEPLHDPDSFEGRQAAVAGYHVAQLRHHVDALAGMGRHILLGGLLVTLLQEIRSEQRLIEARRVREGVARRLPGPRLVPRPRRAGEAQH